MPLPRCIIPGRTYLVTRRCTQRQFLLRPDADTTNAFLYCLAHAAARAQMQVVAFLAHANHHHTIVVDPHGRMPEFLEGFHKLLAKHQNALRGRWENFWASEQTSVVELVEPEDVLAKMVYTLTNPVKDHLVERADQWPGASSLAANLRGRILRAKRPWRFFRKKGGLPDSIALECTRPVGFEHLPTDEWRRQLTERIRHVEKTAADDRDRRGVPLLGRATVLRQRPTDRPTSREPRRALRPHLAARNMEARAEALQRNRAFHEAYRIARDLWQAGKEALFPPGTYWLCRFAAVRTAAAH